MRPLPVLLTRARADAERLAAQLRAAGAAHVEIAPLLRIVPTGALPTKPAALLLTSGNAVDAWTLGGGASGLPVWTVGPRTADRARAAGLELRGVAADVEALAALVPADAPPLVHLRGAEVRGDLVGALRLRGLAATEIVVYVQQTLALSEAARALLKAGPVIAPLYSVRSAERLIGQLDPLERAELRPVCLSEAVAEACGLPGCVVADAPDGAAMLRAVIARMGASTVEGREASV